MKWSLTVMIFSLALSVQCGHQLPDVPSETNSLEGMWTESFDFNLLRDEFKPTGSADISGMERTSTLSLFGEQFALRIQPPRSAFLFEPDTFYVGWANDTLFTGVYEIRHDSLLMNLAENDRIERFVFAIEENRLCISTVGEPGPGGIVAVPMSSFLWGDSFGKSSGEFTRVE